MSKGFASSSNAQSTLNSSNLTPSAGQNGHASNGQFFVVPPVASTSTGSAAWQAPAHWNLEQTSQPQPSLVHYTKKPPKVKKRAAEEQEIAKQTAARFASRLALDQAAVLNPDVDTPFEDHLDVVNRLLPYHVYQQPKEDLEALMNSKGKGRAAVHDLQAEVEETRFALECYKRRETLRDRWKNIKIREGMHASPANQAYVLAQAILEADRSETVVLSNELRTARGELERIQREQRASASARVTQFSSTTPVSMQNIQAQYYRPYPYAYSQPYANPTSTTSTFPATPATPVAYTTYQPGGAIPVQLPVASLPALHALGIVPVPAASLPPEGQPQSPAVLRGSSANGTILSLEINVSLLQSAQMSGLAMILNSLMARTAAAGGTVAVGQNSPTPAPELEKQGAEATST